jgi:uncharacterized protein YecE (DUF72 family)
VARARIGISGYDYRHWAGSFYPAEVRRSRWLEYASGRFDTIEINGTFYSLKSPPVFRRWREAVAGRDFLFAIKGSRFITHNLKLRNAERALGNFYASGILALGRHTGPFLWQLPASYAFSAERIEGFLALLPRSSAEAETLAANHDARLKRGALTEAAEAVPYRHAFEVRHPSYFDPAFYALLRRHGAAFVVADTARRWGYAEEVTADFAYVRLHGASELYASGYTDAELDAWAERLRGWLRPPVRDAFVYFDNDARGHAPHDALRLHARLAAAGLAAGVPAAPDERAG